MKTFTGTRVPKLTSYGTLTWENLVRIIDDERQKTRTLKEEEGREFNWGYRGSSPSALAYSITKYLYGKRKAQDYSWILLETLIQELPSGKNWEIPEEAVHYIMRKAGVNTGKRKDSGKESLRGLIADFVYEGDGKEKIVWEGEEYNGNSEFI